MDRVSQVIEYKCPCCSTALHYSQRSGKLTCASCNNEFELDTVKAFHDTDAPDSFQWDKQTAEAMSDQENAVLQTFTCPSCGGVLITDYATAATFCPYCENAAILPGRVSGALRPDGVIPFIKTKDDARRAFADLCKNKPLLPKGFYDDQRLEKISGVYVPFWLYDCSGGFQGRYNATRVRHWSDSNYNYTKTSYYLLLRGAEAAFAGIPMDGSSKMDNVVMESIEPFDYSRLVPFNTAYLSGFLADKYDVSAASGESRIRERVDCSFTDLLSPTFVGFNSVIPTSRNLHISHSKARYVLLPVWMLSSRYDGKTYTFAMNGQTGSLTGNLPICPKRTAAWFGGIAAAVTALAALIMCLM